ncbi:MAG TPA: MFS transporter [Solirubrobacterales bacterium]|jgi:EmrB/QacA subfamily drug resistance transporter
MTSLAPEITAAEPQADERQPWSILALLVVAQFMVILDITIVNVALPSIGSGLDFSPADLQWVVTAYVICSGGLVLLGGRAADFFGRRRVFLTGLLLFVLASAGSGLAPSSGALVAARALQGCGAAMMTPAALSIISATYTGAQRTTALSIWGAIASGGIAAGVVLGGILTTWLGWRSVFLVNVPVGAVAFLLAPRLVPALPADRARAGLDPFGAISLVGGLAALVYGLSGAAEHGWGSSRTLTPLVVAGALLAVFALVERSVSEPLVPPATWRQRPLIGGSAVILGATGILAGTFFLVSVYLQDQLGFSALGTGLAFLPFVLATGVGVHGTSHFVSHAGSRPLMAGGMALSALAAGLLALAAPGSYPAAVLPGLIVLGLGMGLAIPASSITALSEAEGDGAGLSSGVLSTGHEVGAALGTAILSAIAASGASGSAWSFSGAFAAAAVISALLVLAALTLAPSVRPAPGTVVNVH